MVSNAERVLGVAATVIVHHQVTLCLFTDLVVQDNNSKYNIYSHDQSQLIGTVRVRMNIHL